MQQRTITIVGGGFSGSMLAVQLANLPGPLSGTVHLVEPRPQAGPGLAYTARRPEYLLNVRAHNLSALPHEPAHFLNWLQASQAPECPSGFCSRQTYGRYLAELADRLLTKPSANGLTFYHHRQEATAVHAPNGASGARVQLADGSELQTDSVVLALGNFPPPPPAGPGPYQQHPGYHGNPWAPGALRNIGLDEAVVLVGSGLTAVDVLLGLRTDEHRAPVTVVSRHQRWPAAHKPLTEPYPSFYEARIRGLHTVGEVLAAVRQQVRLAAAQGTDWRPVLDSLRPHLSLIWAAWPLQEQNRFLRHLASIWGVLRHRSPPENDAAVQQMLETGQLRMHSGRVKAIAVQGHDLQVMVSHRGQTTTLTAQHVINCTGPLLDYSRIQAPVVTGLRQAGLLVPDPLRLGLLTDAHGALVGATGTASDWLFTLGPSRRPAYFESTAVPELRQQAVALAHELAARWTGVRS